MAAVPWIGPDLARETLLTYRATGPVPSQASCHGPLDPWTESHLPAWLNDSGVLGTRWGKFLIESFLANANSTDEACALVRGGAKAV